MVGLPVWAVTRAHVDGCLYRARAGGSGLVGSAVATAPRVGRVGHHRRRLPAVGQLFVCLLARDQPSRMVGAG